MTDLPGAFGDHNLGRSVLACPPTLSTVSMAAPVCSGLPATINLTGLLVSTTHNVVYTIDGGAPQTVIGVLSDGSGNASFTTINLVTGNTVIEITELVNTDEDPDCSQTFSGKTATLTVNPLPSPGSITSGERLICEGGDPVGFTATAVSGVTYQWQYSQTGGASWTNATGLGGVTSQNYNIPSGGVPDPEVTTLYRRVVTSNANGCTNVSNSVTVYVNTIDVGTIASGTPQTICVGDVISAIDASTPNSISGAGLVVTTTFQWQQSANGINGWTNIAGATAEDYTPSGLMATTYYRRVVSVSVDGSAIPTNPTSVSCSKIPAAYQAVVYVNAINPGTISLGPGSNVQTICEAGDPSAFAAPAATVPVGATRTYVWEYRAKNSSDPWVAAPGTTDIEDYNAPAASITFDAEFRRRVISVLNGVSCEAITVNYPTIDINAIPDPGTISYAGDPDYDICSLEQLQSFFGTAGSADGTIAYQWRSSTSTNVPPLTNNITGGTNQDLLTPPAATVTTHFGRRITSTLNGVACRSFSNVITITVNANPSNPSVTPSSTQSFCTEAASVNVTYTIAVGSGGDIVEWSFDDFATIAGSGTGAQTISVPAPTPNPPGFVSTIVKFRSKNSTTGCVSTGISRTVSFYPPATANAGADASICYNGTANLNGSIGGGATSATWTASVGGGTFAPNATTLNASYTPPTNYIGTIVLTLTTNDPTGPCGTASDQMTLTVYQPLTTSITGAANVCLNGSISLTGSFAGGSGVISTHNWSVTPGTGNATVTTGAASATLTGTQAGTVTVSYTVTDNAGCQTVTTGTLAVTVDAAPTISGCPSDFNLNTDFGICTATTSWTHPNIAGLTPACGPATLEVDYGLGAGFETIMPGSGATQTFPLGTTNAAYRLTDNIGNVALCNFSVTVSDNEAPVLTTCPDTRSVNGCLEDITGPVYSSTVAASNYAEFSGGDNNGVGSDNCSLTITYQDQTSGTCPIVVTRTWTLSDGVSSVTCDQTINVTQPAPSFATTSDIHISCGDAPPTGTSLSYSNGQSGICEISGSVTGSISGTHTKCGGTYTESWTYTDDCGRTITASRTITVDPTAAAAFASTSDINITCDAAPPVGTLLAYTNGENGACEISGSVLGSITGSHDECGGTYTESWTYTDDCSRTITASRTITVAPAPEATFASAANLNISCGDAPPVGTLLSYTNNASGACAISGSVTGTISGGHDECGGSYTESWEFTDDCGRTINASRLITVAPAAPAAFESTSNISIDCNFAPPLGTPLNYNNGEADACKISGTVTGSIISGSHDECGGSYVESWEYTDDCGRTINASRTITVNPAPVAAFEAAANINVACGAAPPTGSPLNYTNGETGACAISGTVTGTVTGSYTECGGTYTESWSFTDDCGRTITASRTITVDPAPQATFETTSDIHIACSAAPPTGSPLAYSNGETGACAISGTVTGTVTGSYTECGGTYTETWEYTDDCGRPITASRTITVDPAPEAAFAATSDISIPCGSAPPTGTLLAYTNGESGDCAISGSVLGTVTGSHTECGGAYTENWEYTDDCGRPITASRTITVEPAPEATFAPAADLNISCGDAPPVGTLLSYSNNASGACEISGSVTGTISGGHDECGGSYTESWEFTDDCGRTINASRLITVAPAAPAAFESTSNISIDCNFAPPLGTPLNYNNGEAGACKISGTVTGSILGSHDECGGSYVESWEYTDDCGRTITASRTITVNPAPVAAFEATSDINIACGAAPPTGTPLSYTNGEAFGCEISGAVTGNISGSHDECGGSYTESWVFTDNCSRTITASRTITVDPAPQATFETTSDIHIACSAAPPTGSPLAYSNGETGACAISGTVTGTVTGSYTECGGTYTETWEFTDDCGRPITASRTITVDPAPEAAFAATSDISIPCGSAPPTGTLLAYTNGESGDCAISGSVLGTVTGSHTECGGAYTESWEFTDDCGRPITASRTITVEPAPEATFAPAADLNISCGDAPPVGTLLSYSNNASGACEISGSVTGTISGGHDECGGSYTESWEFTDDCGRTINASRLITVAPAAPAAFESTSNISIDCNLAPPLGTPLSYSNSETGACEITGSVTGSILGSHDECGGSYVESWEYTDDCGRTINASRTITVNPAPVAAFEATSDINIACGAAPPTGTPLSYTNGEVFGCEISGTVTGAVTGSHTECGGTYTETWEYTDDCNRTITASRTITVDPAPQATFETTSDIHIACSAAPPTGSPLVYSNGETGACAISGTVTGTVTGSYTECGGTYTETWEFTDDCGRPITASRTITVDPAAQAVFEATSDINIPCGSAPPTATELFYSNGESGDCAISGYTLGTINGSHDECGGSYTESWTYTDDCSRTITASRTITVDPASEATFEPVTDISIPCGSAPPTGTPLAYSNGETGACAISGTVTGNILGGHNECGGSYTETWEFTDDCGRTISTSRTITVEAADLPTFDATNDINIVCGDAPPTATPLAYTNGQTGACEISGTVMGEISGNHNDCGGTYVETWVFTDLCGRTITTSRNITVDPAPVAAFESTSNINIPCGSAPPTGTPLNYTNGGNGACEISGSVVGDIAGSHNECGGTYLESWSYTDDCGRTITASRTITVDPAPTAAFDATLDIHIACGAAPPTGTDLNYTNGQAGACEISGTVTGSVSGSYDECGGTYVETWSFTDACNRTISASRTITVDPANQATFEPTSNISIACGVAPPVGTDLNYSNGETGACAISGTVTGSILGSHNECGGSYTETWEFTDDCGRLTTTSRTITVEPASEATFEATSDIHIPCGSAPPTGSSLAYTNHENGACEISGAVVGDISGSHTECGGTYTETWTYTDNCSRTISASRTITVDPAPEATFAFAPDLNISCGDAPPVGTPLSYTNNANGACEISGSVTGTISGGHDECGGSYTETWEYTDDCGRSITANRTITVAPAAPATFEATSDISIDCGFAPPLGTPLSYSNGETGDCAISGTVTGSIVSGNHDECGGSYVESWEYTDDCGRTITASRTITVNPAPVAAFEATSDINIACGAAPPTGTPLSYTNGELFACEISGTVTGNISGSHDECGGSYTESWVFTDDCGRTITASRTITVDPAAQATFETTSDIHITCGAAPPAGTPLAYSNGETGACEISGSVVGQINGSHNECGGLYTETWEYLDDCGRTITASRTITVDPAPEATFDPVSDFSIPCGSAPPASTSLSYSNGETGACAIAGSVLSTISGTNDDCGGSYTETWIFTDNCSRTITASRTITVEPATVAVFETTSGYTIACSDAPPAASPLNYTNSESGVCEISGSVIGTISGSHNECGGTYIEEWSFTDDCGRTISASREITVQPAPVAVFEATSNISISCEAAPPVGTPLNYSNGETGACEISGTVTGFIDGTHTECGGTFTETWEFVDACGRRSTTSRVITVEPAPAATFEATSDISIPCSAAPPTGTPLSYTNNGSGACEISGTVTGNISGGHTACGGLYVESWYYLDDCGREVTASRTITVEPAAVATFEATSDIHVACGDAPPSGTALGYTNGEGGTCEISGTVTGNISGTHDECGGLYTETWEYTDGCGRTISTSRTITVDPAPEAAFDATSDISIPCGAAPPTGTPLAYSNGEEGQCDISGTVTGSINGSHDECGGTYTETWEYTDDCGRTISASRTITVDPAVEAAFEPTSDISIACGDAPPTGTPLNYTNGETGACAISGTVTGSIIGGHDECGGSYTETWEFTDDCGRVISAARTITVEPAAEAAFEATSDISIPCGSAPPTGTPLNYTNGETGACEISGTVTGVISGGHDECGGSYLETWEFTDDCGRLITAARTITVESAAVAVFEATSDISIPCGSAPPTGTPLNYTNGETGACEISGTATGLISGSHDECGGTYFETWEYTDDCGRTISAARTITVEPAAVAAFEATADISIPCGSAPPTGTPLSYTNGETGACEISGTVTGIINGSHDECGGTYTETWEFGDECGRTITASRTITVEPAALAAFEATSDINIPCGSAPPTGTPLNYTNGETGACAISGTVTGVINGSHDECGGSYTETWEYTDDCGRTISATRNITVDPASEAIFEPTSDINISCGSAPPVGSPLAYSNGETGLCEISGTVTGDIAGAHDACGGTYTETWVFTDDCGRTITASRTITVDPANEAVFETTSDLNIPCGAAPPTGTPLNYSNGETGACEISGTVIGEVSGSHDDCGGTYVETWVFTDNCSRTITTSRTITVDPAPEATFEPTSDISVACGSAPPTGTPLSFNNGETGACEISGTVTGDISGGHNDCGGSYTETWEYTDDCGRTITASRTITVEPAPVAQFQSVSDLTIPCGAAPPTESELTYTNGETGLCEISGVVFSTISGAHDECGGSYLETWTFTDNCNRTITASRTITVEPAATATFEATSDLTIPCGSAPPTGTPLSYTNGETGVCEISGTVTGTITGSHTECGGTYTESWSFTDDCNRSITASRTITVEPAATASFASTSDISIPCGSAPPVGTMLAYTNGETGACEITGAALGTITGSHTECGGTYTESWEFTDECNRTITASRTITVEPAATAAFASTSDITIPCGSAPPTGTDLSYTNGETGACEISGVVTGSISGSHTECGGLYIESWTFTDDCNRSISASRTITVDPAPVAVFDATSDISIACSDAPPTPTALNFTNGEAGACEISGTIIGTLEGGHDECGGVYEETWSYTDDCGRFVFASRLITVDPAPMAAFAATSDYSIPCSAAPPSATPLSYTNGETGDCAISGSKLGVISGSHTECGGTYTESWSYTDNCGRTATASRTITVEPAAVATFAAVSDISIACGIAPPTGTPLAYSNGANGTCEISGTVTGTISGTHDECGGAYTETWSFTDDCNRTITASRTITVGPAPAAVFAPVANTNIPCSAAPPTATMLSYTNGETGACEISGSVLGTLSGSYNECGGSYTESWTYTDDCGRTITASRVITVDPAPVAVFDPVSNTTISCEAIPPAPSSLHYSNGQTGDCEISGNVTSVITGSYNTCGDVFTETWTYRDACNREVSTSRSITVVAPAPIALDCPADAVEGACQTQAEINDAFNAWLAEFSFSGGCNAFGAIQGNPTAPAFCGGSVSVTYLVQSDCESDQTCTRTFTVTSVPGIAIVCPGAQTQNLGSSCRGSLSNYTGMAVVSNACGTPTVVQSPAPGTLYTGVQSVTVTLTATDNCGSTSCSFVVSFADVTPPTANCPANITQTADPNLCSAVVNFSVPAPHDNCSGATSSASPASGSVFPVGTNTVVVTAVDGSNNMGTCSFTVTVTDDQVPTIQCPSDQTLNLDEFCSVTLGSWEALSVSDNCTPSNMILIAQFPPASEGLVGHNSSVLVTLTARDASFNTSSCTFTVTAKDVTAPMAKCKNASATLGANGTVTLAPSAVNNGSSDNCTFTLTLTPNTFTCANIGTNTVTLKATDGAGLMSSCTAIVTVSDPSLPTAACKNPTIYLDDEGQATLTVADVDNGSADGCGIASMSLSDTEFNCSDISSVQTVTLTVTDNSGNTSTCISYVTVVDNIPPTAVCMDVTVMLRPTGKVTVFGAQLAAGSFDNCAVTSYSPVAKVYTTANIGVNYLTITVSDYSGNTSTCVSQVTVLPFTPENETIVKGEEGGNEGGVTDVLDLNLYPNPAHSDVTAAFVLPAEQTYTLRMYDLSGRMILFHTSLGLKGENYFPIQLEGIAPGLYLVDFQTEGLKLSKRLLIQD